MNKKGPILAVFLAALTMGVPGLVSADTGSYRFDVRTITRPMCQGFVPFTVDPVEGSGSDECRSAYLECERIFSDLASQTADLKGFYKEGPRVYWNSIAQYFAFVEEFQTHHLYMKMTSYTDPSGTKTPEVPMTSSFESDYVEQRDAVKKACPLIFPVDPCGNGLKDSGEFCDDGPDNGKPGKCPDDCRMPVKRPFLWKIPLNGDPWAVKKAF